MPCTHPDRMSLLSIRSSAVLPRSLWYGPTGVNSLPSALYLLHFDPDLQTTPYNAFYASLRRGRLTLVAMTLRCDPHCRGIDTSGGNGNEGTVRARLRAGGPQGQRPPAPALGARTPRAAFPLEGALKTGAPSSGLRSPRCLGDPPGQRQGSGLDVQMT